MTICSGLQTEGRRRAGVEDLIHYLNFQKVVAAAQRAQLIPAPQLGPVGDGGGVGPGHGAARLDEVQVLGLAQTLVLHQVGDAFGQHPDKVSGVDGAGTTALAPAHARGHRPAQIMYQRLDPAGQVVALLRGDQQPHAAVDVEADPAGRDHAVGQQGGRHAAHREAVAFVHVRHAHRRPVDAGQGRHVHQLGHAAVAPDLADQRLVGEHPHRHLGAGRRRVGQLVDDLALAREGQGRGGV